jgi:hypothetical protein
MSEHKEFLPPSPVEEKKELLGEVGDEQSVIADIKTLAMIVELVVSEQEISSGIDISPKVKEILEKLLGEAQYFDKVEEYLHAIIKDNKLDAKDVPIVMLLLTELYERLQGFSMKDISTETCGEVIKTIIEIAIKEKIVPVNEEDLALLSTIYNIVDTSIRLIQMRNQLDEGDVNNPRRGGLLECVINRVRKCFACSEAKKDE